MKGSHLMQYTFPRLNELSSYTLSSNDIERILMWNSPVLEAIVTLRDNHDIYLEDVPEALASYMRTYPSEGIEPVLAELGVVYNRVLFGRSGDDIMQSIILFAKVLETDKRLKVRKYVDLAEKCCDCPAHAGLH